MQQQEKERVSSPCTDMFLYNRLSASRVSAIGLYVCFYVVAHVSPKKKRKKLLTVGSPLHVKRVITGNVAYHFYAIPIRTLAMCK